MVIVNWGILLKSCLAIQNETICLENVIYSCNWKMHFKHNKNKKHLSIMFCSDRQHCVQGAEHREEMLG